MRCALVTGFGPSEDWEPSTDTLSVRQSLLILGVVILVGCAAALGIWLFG